MPQMGVWEIGLWPAIPPTDPQAPENSKTQKSDSKVTFGLLAKLTQKLLKSDSRVARTFQKVTFEPLLRNFWVTLAGSPKVTFESLFSVFEFSGAWGSVGGMAGHKDRGLSKSDDIWRKRLFSSNILDFPRALRTIGKRVKRAEKGQKKGEFRPISRKGSQTPLKA